MILVDSSVWIDYFNGAKTPASQMLDGLLGHEPLLIPDLVLTEVLQGFTLDRDFERARQALGAFPVVVIGGHEAALAAAANYRALRSRGVTVRKTIDTLIATRCLLDDYALLYSDRDFDPFVEYLGLRSVL